MKEAFECKHLRYAQVAAKALRDGWRAEVYTVDDMEAL